MARMKTALGLFVGLLLLSRPVPAAAADKVELRKAFQQGFLQLTFTAKEEGKAVELKVKNVSSKPLVIVVEKGKTPFTTYMREFALVAAEPKELEVPAGGEKAQQFPMEQKGQGRWTSGSITLSK